MSLQEGAGRGGWSVRGAGSGPPRRRHRHKSPEALEVYYKAILRSKNRRVCELPVSPSGSGHSASNKIDCLFSLQTGSSWAPAAPAPKSRRLVPARSAPSSSTSARCRRQLQPPEGSGCRRAHPTTEAWRPGLPHCGFCSVARPERQGPLSCGPGAPSAPLAAASAGAAPGSPPTLSPLHDSAPMVSRVGLFGEVVLG